MTVAKIFKRCDCHDWNCCSHPWVARYRSTGGRSSRQREQSFGDDLREAENFALKVEYEKRGRTFVDPKAGRILFREASGVWLVQHLGTDSSIATYRSVLCADIDPPSAASRSAQSTARTFPRRGERRRLHSADSRADRSGRGRVATGVGRHPVADARLRLAYRRGALARLANPVVN
jgi:hypothetical protein